MSTLAVIHSPNAPDFDIDIFKFDANYLDNEEKYKQIRAEILGEGSSDEEESGSEESESEDEEGT